MSIGRVLALLALPDGDLIAGGEFHYSGDIVIKGFARWHPDTATWTGPGLEEPGSVVRCFALLPSGSVVVGGNFYKCLSDCTTVARALALWNPVTDIWSSVGPAPGLERWSVIGAVAALPDGDLVAAGVFKPYGEPGGWHSIGRFHSATQTWSAFSGSGGNMYCLVLAPDGDLIVGGGMATPLAAPQYVARWNPVTSAWSSLADNLNGWVRAIAKLPNGDFLVGRQPVPVTSDADYLAHLRLPAHEPPGIISGLQSAQTCSFGSVPFHISAAAGTGTLNYLWEVQTSPGTWQTLGNAPIGLPCGGSAAITALDPFTDHPTVAIRPCGGGVRQQFQIRAVISNDDCTTTTTSAVYTVCPADFNCSGSVSVQDIFDFLTAYFTADLRADIDDNGSVGIQDIFDFLAGYFADTHEPP
jgi:hypothetical protein